MKNRTLSALENIAVIVEEHRDDPTDLPIYIIRQLYQRLMRTYDEEDIETRMRIFVTGAKVWMRIRRIVSDAVFSEIKVFTPRLVFRRGRGDTYTRFLDHRFKHDAEFTFDDRLDIVCNTTDAHSIYMTKVGLLTRPRWALMKRRQYVASLFDDDGRENIMFANMSFERVYDRYIPIVPITREFVDGVIADRHRYELFVRENTVPFVPMLKGSRRVLAQLWHDLHAGKSICERLNTMTVRSLQEYVTSRVPEMKAVEESAGTDHLQVFMNDGRIALYCGPSIDFKLRPQDINYDHPDVNKLIHSISAPPMASEKVLDLSLRM